MQTRYPNLVAFAMILRILGWLVFVGGVFSSLRQGMALIQCMPHCQINLAWLFQNAQLLIMGGMTIVLGEGVAVLLSIDTSARRLADASGAGTTALTDVSRVNS